jgi:hypothetical protein
MIGHYPLGYWGSSNIFWALKQAEYANALWNFIWIFFTLYNTICSVIGQSKKKVILYYTWKKKWVNLRVMTSQQQCREQLVRYWKLWSVWLKKESREDENWKYPMDSNYVQECFRFPLASACNVCAQDVANQSLQDENKSTGMIFHETRKAISTFMDTIFNIISCWFHKITPTRAEH